MPIPVHWNGAIAQLGERLHGMQEVSGSIPLGSTTFVLIISKLTRFDLFEARAKISHGKCTVSGEHGIGFVSRNFENRLPSCAAIRTTGTSVAFSPELAAPSSKSERAMSRPRRTTFRGSTRNIDPLQNSLQAGGDATLTFTSRRHGRLHQARTTCRRDAREVGSRYGRALHHFFKRLRSCPAHARPHVGPGNYVGRTI